MAGDVFDTGLGGRISVGLRIGEGGEGSVYEVRGRPETVAKVYSCSVGPDKVAKLALMARTVTPQLLDVAAWPTDILSEPGGRKVRGLLMPRVPAAREAHCVYSPKQRQQLYPSANWKFLLCVARNIAAAVDVVHAAGHVIGDINQKGFLVGQDATVRLIDCDSFQIAAGNERYLCAVGVPEFTPPELIGASFGHVIRTANHDAFGLAVLLFHFVYMGRHPFAGRYTGSGDMPVDRAVRELRFAYSQRAATMQMSPPPHSLPLTAASLPIAALFERAFAPDGVRENRPTATEWVQGIERLCSELKTCSDDKSHVYFTGLAQCPWCQIERNGGPTFFLPQFTGDVLQPFDATRLASLLGALTLPVTVGPMSFPGVPLPVRPAPVPRPIQRRRLGALAAGMMAVLMILSAFIDGVPVGLGAAGLGLVGVAWFLRTGAPVREERKRRQEAKGQAERNWNQLSSGWHRDCMAALRAVQAKRTEFQRNLTEIQALPLVRQARLKKLHDERERLQLQAYLERFGVERSRITGIGPGIKAILMAYGFETAHDVTSAVAGVKGIGPVKYSALLAWRRTLELQFRFDPSQGVSDAQRAACERSIVLRYRELEKLLAQGELELKALHGRAVKLLSPDPQPFARAAERVVQARADLTML